VLSKLRHKGNRTHDKICLQDLEAMLGFKIKNIQNVQGGTLGICLLADTGVKTLFFKTHSGDARDLLQKEIALMKHVNGAIMDVRSFELPDRVWLVCDALQPCPPLTPDAVRALTSSYTTRIKTFPDVTLVPNNKDFAYLMGEAREALNLLFIQKQISEVTQTLCTESLHLLGKQDFQPVLCHGDLGPKNIMLAGNQPVAIDWEDAFWGVDGYDYLYWLTFFENRRYYDASVLGHTPWGKDIERALLVMIILLKCVLSYKSSTHINNALSFDQRIWEVAHID